MGPEPAAQDEERERTEVARLRARIDELERELAERTARAEAAVAAAQDRSYWQERLRIDLDAVMRRPVARALFQALLGAIGGLRALKRRLG